MGSSARREPARFQHQNGLASEPRFVEKRQGNTGCLASTWLGHKHSGSGVNQGCPKGRQSLLNWENFGHESCLHCTKQSFSVLFYWLK
jgi:hypothetical protein